jgi:tripartite-type tricarboxylate transporter receptor subunit TctC
LPNVAPIAELGVPDYEMGDWIGIVAPAKTPPAVIAKLNAAINKALTVPDVRARIEKIGTQVEDQNTPEQFAAFIKKETDKWAKVIPAMGVTLK